MNERQALLRALIDNPDDDGPRLVYSDWLEEHGDTESDRARAAFIRLQVECTRLGPYDPIRLDLEGQAEALLRAHCKAWLAGLDKWMVNHHFTSIERGFPVVVQASVSELLDRGDELWAAAPFRHLDIWQARAAAGE
ncbi:MAG: TIGR02996 domain-containing protein [Gemmataceae bacterium]|nr:TIGR02996 domain-containing protein [Gemmataceae bacterium]